MEKGDPIYAIIEGNYNTLQNLLREETSLEEECAAIRHTAKCLNDIVALSNLADIKLRIALQTIKILRDDNINIEGKPALRENFFELAKRKARQAYYYLILLQTPPLAVGSKRLINENVEYQQAIKLFNELIVQGGAIYFEPDLEERQNNEKVIKTLVNSLSKYVLPDDSYDLLIRAEKLPPILRRIVHAFFSVMCPEDQKGPPYGIEDEADQELIYSDYMKLPLSQAIVYYEQDLLPFLEKKRGPTGPDKELEDKILFLKKRIEDYKKIELKPRSTPIILEKDYYTLGLTHYTPDGELLVPVYMPVTFLSGTNTDRIKACVKEELTRKLAGKGISQELDRDYYYRKSLDSGTHGNSLFPSTKIDKEKCFTFLRMSYPTLYALENNNFLRDIIQLLRNKGKKAVRDKLTALARSSLPVSSHTLLQKNNAPSR